MKLSKNFINKRILPTIGTPVFLGISGVIAGLKTNNKQYYGETLMKIHDKYRYCAWLPIVIFKLGYIQALIDSNQKLSFDFTCQDMNVINRSVAALTGQMKGGAA